MWWSSWWSELTTQTPIPTLTLTLILTRHKPASQSESVSHYPKYLMPVCRLLVLTKTLVVPLDPSDPNSQATLTDAFRSITAVEARSVHLLTD